jgi:hypothetical protein
MIPKSVLNLKNLQRLILHENNLEGDISFLSELNCVVNVADNDAIIHTKDVPVYERDALLKFGGNSTIYKLGSYFKSESTYKSNLYKWNTNTPVYNWYHIGVINGHVESLTFTYSDHKIDKFDPSIKNLHYLKMIEISSTPNITAQLTPDLCSLTSLMRICITNTGLCGSIPKEIGNLVNLIELQLHNNKLTGYIPEELGLLTNLELLSLGEYSGGNDFSPQCIPNLSGLVKLSSLFLARCNLEGPLPVWLSNLTCLKSCDLHQNKLDGTLTPLLLLNNIEYLNVKENLLSGSIPVDELKQLKNLHKLSLICNNFENKQQALSIETDTCHVWV